MNSKSSIWLGLLVGSTLGSLIPSLWGDSSLFSFSSLLLGSAGAVLGIYVGFKLSR